MNLIFYWQPLPTRQNGSLSSPCRCQHVATPWENWSVRRSLMLASISVHCVYVGIMCAPAHPSATILLPRVTCLSDSDTHLISIVVRCLVPSDVTSLPPMVHFSHDCHPHLISILHYEYIQKIVLVVYFSVASSHQQTLFTIPLLYGPTHLLRTAPNLFL